MADIEVPGTDAVVDDEIDIEEPHLSAEVPEADAIEQAQVVTVASRREVPSIRDDVPEADALEQAYAVDMDDDYRG